MKRKDLLIALFFGLVGVARFELATLCSQSRYANRTALHPDDLSVLCEGKGSYFIQITKRPTSFGGADALELYLARPIPQGLTRWSPSSDTSPLYDATFIPYAASRRIPDAGEYRIELDRVP